MILFIWPVSIWTNQCFQFCAISDCRILESLIQSEFRVCFVYFVFVSGVRGFHGAKKWQLFDVGRWEKAAPSIYRAVPPAVFSFGIYVEEISFFQTQFVIVFRCEAVQGLAFSGSVLLCYCFILSSAVIGARRGSTDRPVTLYSFRCGCDPVDDAVRTLHGQLVSKQRRTFVYDGRSQRVSERRLPEFDWAIQLNDAVHTILIFPSGNVASEAVERPGLPFQLWQWYRQLVVCCLE